jgi:hypothetical protein
LIQKYYLLKTTDLNTIACVMKSRKMRWAGHVAYVRDRRVIYRVLVGRLGKRPLGRPGHRWEDTIKVNLQEVGWGHGLDCSGSE